LTLTKNEGHRFQKRRPSFPKTKGIVSEKNIFFRETASSKTELVNAQATARHKSDAEQESL